MKKYVGEIVTFLILLLVILPLPIFFYYESKNEPVVVCEKSPDVPDAYRHTTDYEPYVEEPKSSLTGGIDVPDKVDNNWDIGVVTESDGVWVWVTNEVLTQREINQMYELTR